MLEKINTIVFRGIPKLQKEGKYGYLHSYK